MEAIRLDGDNIVIHGQRLTREQFKAALDAIRADPNSAFSNTRDPNHKQAVEEMNLAYKGLAGELSETDITEIIGEWNQALEEPEVTDTLQPFQQIAEMWKNPEVRAAKQRRDAGARLDDREKEIMRQYDQLEAANNAQAYREQASKGGTFKIARPERRAPELFAIEKITDRHERLNAVRTQIATWRDNKDHPYNNANHVEHRNAVGDMQRLYQEQERLESGDE